MQITVNRHLRRTRNGRTIVRTHTRNYSKCFTPVYSGFSKNAKQVMMSPTQFLKTTHDQVYQENERMRFRRYSERLKAGKDINTLYDDIPDLTSYNDYIKFVIKREKVEGIKAKLKKCNNLKENEKLPIPFLEYNREGIPVSHEGRHTAQACKELKIKKIPVTVDIGKYY